MYKMVRCDLPLFVLRGSYSIRVSQCVLINEVLRYVKSEMNMHAFVNELDQKDCWYPRKNKICENLCTKSMESCPLVIWHILEASWVSLDNNVTYLIASYFKTCAARPRGRRQAWAQFLQVWRWQNPSEHWDLGSDLRPALWLEEGERDVTPPAGQADEEQRDDSSRSVTNVVDAPCDARYAERDCGCTRTATLSAQPWCLRSYARARIRAHPQTSVTFIHIPLDKSVR